MPGPDPAVAAARSAVRAVLADLAPGTRVLVACSGGADSLALAAATAFVAPRTGLLAGSVTVDHGLLPGSADVARRAASTCAGLGLEPALVRTVDVPRAGAGGPEAAARDARYAALDAAAEEEGAAVVLLGHTLDDQAETVLLALARGSGARSLAGMPPRRGRLRRPLLGLRRADTERVCAVLGLDAVEDPGNRAAGPWRTADGGPLRRAAVREHALPALAEALGPGVPQALARTADLLRDDADLLDALAAELLDRAWARGPAEGAGGEGAAVTGPARQGRPGGDGGAVVLDVATLAAAPPALRRRALHAAARDAGCPAGALSAAHVAALDALVAGYHGQGATMLPGGVEGERRCGRLVLARGAAADDPSSGERDGSARGRHGHG